MFSIHNNSNNNINMNQKFYADFLFFFSRLSSKTLLCFWFDFRRGDFKMKLSVLLETFPLTVDWANRHQPTHNKT